MVVVGWKVEFSFVTTDALGSFIISHGCFFSSVECPKPNSDTFLWITNLSCPFSPWPLPNPSVLVLPYPLITITITITTTFLISPNYYCFKANQKNINNTFFNLLPYQKNHYFTNKMEKKKHIFHLQRFNLSPSPPHKTFLSPFFFTFSISQHKKAHFFSYKMQN